jgi:hypothetical protein
LCCTGCGHWYRIDAGGGLIEAKAPKNFSRGSLRYYRGNGREGIVPLTALDLQRHGARRWSLGRLWRTRPTNLRTFGVESFAVLVLLGYLVGIFALCYWQYVGPSAGDRRPPPPVLSQ